MRTSRLYRLSDEEFAKIVAESSGVTEIAPKCGLSPRGSNRNTIKKRIYALGLDISHFTRWGYDWVSSSDNPPSARFSLDEILVKNSTYANTSRLKSRLLRADLLTNRCYVCRQEPVWKGRSLVLILDHINGDRADNRLKNLRLVCPNCDSQLETYKSKNARKR
jgi:hypothetical protein